MPIVTMLYLDNVEARGLFEPVPDGKAEPGSIRALRINFRHSLVVKFPKRVEDASGLLGFVSERTEVVDNMAGIEPGEFGKADDARRRGKMRLNVPRAFFGVSRKDGNGRFRRVVPVFHAGRFRLFPVLEQAHDRLVYGDLALNVLEHFQRQPARAKKTRWGTGEVDDR